jgi:uncharacterized protein (TIGR02118 family)
MVRAVVLYGPPEDPNAFERYYAETHTALAKAIPGLQRFEAARGIATPDGSAVPYQRIAELTFEDMDALQAGLGSDEGQAAVNDIPNFATGGVTIFFAEIVRTGVVEGGPLGRGRVCSMHGDAWGDNTVARVIGSV